MNRFNLTFSGEILPGHDPELVRLRFANLFDIDDPERLKQLFSGGTFILRRNLERKDAAKYYHDLQLLGAGAALVKVTASDMADDIVDAAHPEKPSKDRTNAIVRDATTAAMPQTRAAAEALDKNNPVSWPPNSTDAAAEIKARKLAAQQLAAEKAALEQATLEEEQRQIAAVADREKAIAAERLRVAEEERARIEAEQARLAAEKAARKAAEHAELRRLEAEEIAKKEALKAQAKRKAAEEAAERKARKNQQKAEKAQRKAEEAARRKAELEEQQRLAAEEEARRIAELEKQKRLAAEREARRTAEIEKQKRLAAADIARKAAAAAAREAKRLAELGALKHREAEEAARLQAELEEKARQAATTAAQIKAEADHLLAQAQRKAVERRLAVSQELAAQQAPAEAALAASAETTSKRHTNPVARQPVTKSTKARVKTTMDTPQRKRAEESAAPAQRKRMPGEPNLYTLRPFRNSEEVRTRATLAGERRRRGYTLGVIALAALLIVGGSFLQHRNYPVITGADAIAINSNSEPLLLAGDSLLFHDRAGISTATVLLSAWGLTALAPPLAFDGKDMLFARGQLHEERTEDAQAEVLQLLRCDVTTSSCEPFFAELGDRSIDAFAINPLDSSLLLADTGAGELLKVDASGTEIAHAAVTLPQQPVLRMHSGLLLVNSAQGPAISVFRYEDDAFGTQLDEILLLPSTGQSLEHYRVHDFVWSGNAWWVNLVEPDSGHSEVHRFDQDWNYLDSVSLPSDIGPLQLVNWGQKTLTNDPRDPTIRRYNNNGAPEAPFNSTQLQESITNQQQYAGLATIIWKMALLLCALTMLVACGYGYLQGTRRLVYKLHREQGAEPLDDYSAQLHWIDPIADRHLQLQKTGMYYGLAVLAATVLAIASNVSVWQLAALLLALSGPAIAILLLSRQPTGHIGTLGDKLLLVDHTGMYHIAGGSRLQYRDPFLAIDDVVVFTGTPLLPAFSSNQVQQQVKPLALGGIKVDQKTLMVKLLQCRHPLAQGTVATLITLAGAALLLSLEGMI